MVPWVVYDADPTLKQYWVNASCLGLFNVNLGLHSCDLSQLTHYANAGSTLAKLYDTDKNTVYSLPWTAPTINQHRVNTERPSLPQISQQAPHPQRDTWQQTRDQACAVYPEGYSHLSFARFYSFLKLTGASGSLSSSELFAPSFAALLRYSRWSQTTLSTSVKMTGASGMMLNFRDGFSLLVNCWCMCVNVAVQSMRLEPL